MTDLTAIKTPFGLLDRETQEALKAHGGPYEFWPSYSDDWGIAPNDTDCWINRMIYRVKPAPPKLREVWLRTNHNGELRECDEESAGAKLYREVLPE